MRFEIQVVLDWCAIFGGTMAGPMQCQLALEGGGYHLIYIDMPSQGAGEDDNIDVFKLLNKAFDAGLPENTLFVQQAGFFSFADSTTPPRSAALDTIFPQAPIPAAVATTARPIANSTSFWLTLRLRSNALFNSLIEVGADHGAGQEADLSLYASLNNTLPAKQAIREATYTAVLPEFKLFDLFTFSAVVLGYQFDTAANYSLQGTIALDLFGKPYSFDGQLVANGTVLQACLASSNPDSTVPQLFDDAMRGISFSGLGFGVYYTFATATASGTGVYRVQGSVQYGNSLAFTGQIYLQDATPLLATVAIDRDLSIAEVFTQSIPGCVWPSDLVNIVFLAGSAIYYRKETGDKAIVPVDFPCPVSGQIQALPPQASQIDYQPGFHLHAKFDLTLLATLRLEGDVQITSGGVSAQIQLVDPISIFVLQLIGDQATNGPIFRFSSVGGSSMGFQCGLLFFQENFGLNVTVSGTKSPGGKLKLSGLLYSDKTFAPVFTQPPRLSFSYSKDDGFHVDNWPAFGFMDQAIDFVKALKELSSAGSGGCGALGDFIDKHVVTTKFTITPSFRTQANQPPEQDGLFLVLNGTYQMAFAGQVFATLQFPNAVEFVVPNTLSLDGLPAAIGAALASAATSFVTGLLNNSAAVATFLALTAGEAAAKYAATLVCQGLADGAASAATSAAASALAGAGGVAAGAAAGAAAAGAAGHSVDSSCFVAGTIVALADGGERPIELIMPGKWVLGADGHHNRVLGFDAPRLGQRLLHALNGGRHFVTAEHPFMTERGWMAIDPDATLRENPGLSVGRLQLGDRLLRRDQPSLLLEHMDSRAAHARTQLYNLLLDGDHTYYADGYLVHNKGSHPSHPGDPAPPTDLACGYANGTMTLSWTPASNASGYQVSLSDPNNHQVYQQSVAYDVSAVTLGRLASMVPGTYVWSVSATKGSFVSAASSANQTCLAVPVLEATLSGETGTEVALVLRWGAISGATHYLPTVLQGDTPIPQASVDAPRLTSSFEFGDRPPGEYRFSVVAGNNPQAIASDPCPPQVWTRLASPAQVQASYGNGTISVQWPAVSGVSCYQLSLYDPARQLIYQATDSAGRGEAQITLPEPARAGAYQLYLNSMPEGRPGVRQIPGVRTPPQSVVVQLTPGQVAKQAYLQHASGVDCAELLLATFPALYAVAMAVAMAAAGYVASATGQGLRAAYPAMAASELAAVLLAAYGRALTMEELAVQAFQQNKSGAECGALLIAAYPSVLALPLGQSMKAAGYLADATAEGLKAAYPQIGAPELAADLLAIYGQAQTLDQLATEAHLANKDGAACGALLIATYPATTDLALGGAMKRADYPAAATAAGILSAFPAITAPRLTTVLLQIYG